jgi:5-methylcytosine-specific restriction endonuclease McrA
MRSRAGRKAWKQGRRFRILNNLKTIKMDTKKYTDEEFKERRKERKKEYRAKPEVKERKKEYGKEYRAKPEVKEREKEHFAKPEVKERKKEYMKEYRAKPEVKEREKEHGKEYRAKLEAKERESQRTLVRRSKGGYVSRIDRQLIYERDAYKCAYAGCNKIVIVSVPHSNPLQATIDHIIPISKGGLSIYSNMITMCRVCNCYTKRTNRSSDETRLLELAHARNVEFGLVDAKTKWEKGQQDDRVAGMGGG